MPRRRTPQLNDTVHMEVRFPPQTEEWADKLLAQDFDVERTDKALVVREQIGGNCNGVVNLQGFLRDIEEALLEGDIDPMEFTVRVWAEEPKQ